MTIALERKVKLVVRCQTGRSEAQIRNYFASVVKPKLDAAVTTRFGQHVTGMQVLYKLQVNKRAGVAEIYPKLFITGTTERTEAQVDAAIDDLLDDFKTTVLADMVADGASNFQWHRHKSTGAVI